MVQIFIWMSLLLLSCGCEQKEEDPHDIDLMVQVDEELGEGALADEPALPQETIIKEL